MSIYPTKYCKNMFLAVPRPAYFNIQSSSGQHYYIKGHHKAIITSELQLNLQKYIKICFCSFNKISNKEEKLCCKKILT